MKIGVPYEYFQERFRIPDIEWSTVVEFFKLPKHASIHHIRILKKKVNENFLAKPTAGGRGYEINPIHLLQYILKQRPPTDPSKPIQVKFAFDGASVTTKRRRQEEVATIDVIIDRTTSEAKSYKNSNQYMIYLGGEDYKTMKEELTVVIPLIKSLIDGEKV